MTAQARDSPVQDDNVNDGLISINTVIRSHVVIIGQSVHNKCIKQRRKITIDKNLEYANCYLLPKKTKF